MGLRDCGCSVTTSTRDQYRITSTSSCIQSHFQSMRSSTCQFIWNTSKSTIAVICVTSPTCRSMGSRCDVPRLVRNARICIPTICSDNEDSSANISTFCHNTANSTSRNSHGFPVYYSCLLNTHCPLFLVCYRRTR